MRKLIPVALACWSLALGCGPPNPATIRSIRRDPVRLTVQNNRFEDATISALWQGGAKRRVGMVTGATTQTFTFDWVSDEVRLEVDFIAAEDYTVDPIDVDPGDHLDLTILNIRQPR
jgi:hypothetical protein